MDRSRDPALTPPAQLAKSALRRLVAQRLEPTPDNYRQAYLEEAGLPAGAPPPPAAPDGAGLAALVERLLHGVEQGGRGWTRARRKDSLRRVLEGSRTDAARLQQRLAQLASHWEADAPDDAVHTEPAPLDAVPIAGTGPGAGAGPGPGATVAPPGAWPEVASLLAGTVGHALPAAPAHGHALAGELAELVARLADDGPTPARHAELEAACRRAARVLQHRHHLTDQLGALCRELAASLAELAEDDSWAQGQCEAMRQRLEDGLSARGVRAVGELLRDTRERQQQLRSERERARDALKTLIHRMIAELGELGAHTGRFHESVGRYADVIERADSLESLAGVVRELVEESRTVQAVVGQAQEQLRSEHARATGLAERVQALEAELQRLSAEVSTDPLTQVANRRGLLQAFDAECARAARDGAELLVALLDIDNFKRLNDDLGHSAGDEALRTLAAVVSQALRPTDVVARYGGEEFVVLLPGTPLDEGQQILTRLQRSLSGALFMHEQRPVFVTFSAGVTRHVAGEPIDQALERADEALYEAKRTGKNRTCVA